MTLDADNRTKTENFIRLVFKTFDVSSDGSVTGEEVARVLTALGRPQVAGQSSCKRNIAKFSQYSERCSSSALTLEITIFKQVGLTLG